MLHAMQTDFGLYVIITNPSLPPREIASLCVKCGVRYLQLREKQADARRILQMAEEILAVTRGSDTLFFINDRVDLALAAGADGVHLGQEDLSISEARRIAAGTPLRIGLSTHSLEQARAALQTRPDYIGFGPIYPTPTKERPDPVVGTGRLRKVLQFADRPVVAIGGIDESNLDEVLAAGARNLCMVRFLMETPDLENRIRITQRRLAKPHSLGSQ